jgi:hypothetical protein
MDKGQTDPAGVYDVDDVTVTADNDALTKSEGATGTFVKIGQDRRGFRTKTEADGHVARSPHRDFTRSVS